MKYGHFNRETDEYVITRPDTPTPWINYLGQKDYFGMISNTAGGYSFYRDPRHRRITRYRYNSVPDNQPGRYIYIRDVEKEDYWSPTWQPVKKPLDSYECRHGLGYTRISSAYNGLNSEITYFVPLDQTLEAWRVVLHNTKEEPVKLQIFSLIEFCLWDALDDMTNFQRNYNTGEVEVEEGVIYHKTEYRERRNHFAYFACSEPLAGFDTSREAFLGSYQGYEGPQVVRQGDSKNSIAHGWAPVGSYQVQITLAPDESREIVFLLGYSENPEYEKFSEPGIINKSRARETIEQYLDPAQLDADFEDLREYWEKLRSAYQVETPDRDVNLMINTWNPYQCMATFNLSRSASLYESGIGRGIGFRDSNQDLLGFVHMVPERARQRILDLAATQMKSGGAYHQYDPLTKEGNEKIGSGFNDDPMWLILSVAAYLKETGDYSILEEPVVYENEFGTEEPLHEHLERALQYILDRLGPHGLPLIGHADWNDCLNLNCFSKTPEESFQTHEDKTDGETAESVLISGLFTLAAKEMANIAHNCDYLGDPESYRKHAEKMMKNTMEQAWDGEWFLRAYDHFENKVGSQECEEGKIYVTPQGICTMAGMGREDGRAIQALDSVREHLATKHGIMLHQPSYTRYHPELGEISSYPPGYKENGSVFCHTNPWIMISEAMHKRGDRAFDYYKRICPPARESISEVHKTEPYVYAQTIAGSDAPTFGEAKNSWLTGTAAWNWVAITQWILGIRPEHEGLRVDPCIPSDWSEFEVTRKFRGSTYEIKVENPDHVSSGIRKITIDGESLEDNLIPVSEDRLWDKNLGCHPRCR
ncbi:glycosyl transferase [candidate division MSBL1 archaeon SCGC-AAA259E19]|uniref:Glycosyl transferase n=1 Tax=candidate division MSBL1 archaeon SCGC-AAA259E19 TaxID=1698264 RepID=A0A133UL96_9EURY|nr:glycosyl transferase [candidate division MSBL1 archaeon SCGC-AAA259E19]